MKTDTKSYQPHKNGFPYRFLKYLQENGKSAGIDIQEKVGLNSFFDKKGIVYFNRASNNFDTIVRQLQQRGLVKILPDDWYELTKTGAQFMETYKVR